MTQHAAQQEENLSEEEMLRRKLRYRSWHRGTREMDLIMGRFADEVLPQFTLEQLRSYHDLLVENDPDLYNWISRRETPPQEVLGGTGGVALKALLDFTA
jgi:antitoxin CptB